MIDGKPIFKDEILHGAKPVNTLLGNDGALHGMGAHQDFAYEEQWLNSLAKDAMKMYIDNKYIVPPFPPVAFTPEEQKVITNKWAPIQSFMSEKEQKWLLGNESVDANFDDYISQLKNMGMDEIISIYNDAYQRYQQN
jgi:putative aldouronate transport system substrate-binding protein